MMVEIAKKTGGNDDEQNLFHTDWNKILSWKRIP
jgi:hypothetical protein